MEQERGSPVQPYSHRESFSDREDRPCFSLRPTQTIFKPVIFHTHLEGPPDEGNKSKSKKRKRSHESDKKTDRLIKARGGFQGWPVSRTRRRLFLFLLTFDILLSQPHARFHNPLRGKGQRADPEDARLMYSASYETPRIDSAARIRSSNPSSVVSFFVRVSSNAFLTSFALLLGHRSGPDVVMSASDRYWAVSSSVGRKPSEGVLKKEKIG